MKPIDYSIDTLLNTFKGYSYIDLSHTLEEGIPTYPTHPKYYLSPWKSMGDPAAMNIIVMSDHTGTHMDSPSHFVIEDNDPAKKNIDEIDPTFLIGRAIKATFGPFQANNHMVSKEDIIKWENDNQKIKEGDIFILDFQWGKRRWATGMEGFKFLQGWPGLSNTAVDYLLKKGVKAIGTDCISLDAGDGGRGQLPSHYGLLPNGVLILENLANLEDLPVESFLIAIPLKFKNATGSPIRPIAFIPECF